MLSLLSSQDAEQEEPQVAMARMSGENAELRRQNEALLEYNAQLQETLLQWETAEAQTIEALRADILLKSEELLELTEKYNDALLKIDILDVELNRKSGEMNETLEKNAALVAEVEQLEDEMQDLTGKHAAALQENHLLEEEVVRVSASPTSNGSRLHIFDNGERMRQALAENDALQAAVEQLKTENSKLLDEIKAGTARMMPSERHDEGPQTTSAHAFTLGGLRKASLSGKFATPNNLQKGGEAAWDKLAGSSASEETKARTAHMIAKVNSQPFNRSTAAALNEGIGNLLDQLTEHNDADGSTQTMLPMAAMSEADFKGLLDKVVPACKEVLHGKPASSVCRSRSDLLNAIRLILLKLNKKHLAHAMTQGSIDAANKQILQLNKEGIKQTSTNGKKENEVRKVIAQDQDVLYHIVGAVATDFSQVVREEFSSKRRNADETAVKDVPMPGTTLLVLAGAELVDSDAAEMVKRLLEVLNFEGAFNKRFHQNVHYYVAGIKEAIQEFEDDYGKINSSTILHALVVPILLKHDCKSLNDWRKSLKLLDKWDPAVSTYASMKQQFEDLVQTAVDYQSKYAKELYDKTPVTGFAARVTSSDQDKTAFACFINGTADTTPLCPTCKQRHDPSVPCLTLQSLSKLIDESQPVHALLKEHQNNIKRLVAGKDQKAQDAVAATSKALDEFIKRMDRTVSRMKTTTRRTNAPAARTPAGPTISRPFESIAGEKLRRFKEHNLPHQTCIARAVADQTCTKPGCKFVHDPRYKDCVPTLSAPKDKADVNAASIDQGICELPGCNKPKSGTGKFCSKEHFQAAKSGGGKQKGEASNVMVQVARHEHRYADSAQHEDLNALVAEKFAGLYTVQEDQVTSDDAINNYMRNNAPLDLRSLVDQMPVPGPKTADGGTSGDESEAEYGREALYAAMAEVGTSGDEYEADWGREALYAAILATVSNLVGEGFQADLARVPGDGNCGFHAIARLTHENPITFDRSPFNTCSTTRRNFAIFCQRIRPTVMPILTNTYKE